MDAFLGLPAEERTLRATPGSRQLLTSVMIDPGHECLASGRERKMSDFDMRQTLGRVGLTRRRMLQATAGAGLAVGLPRGRLSLPAYAQEITFSRDFEGTTLNLLMEDLLETTIIEEMLPEFTELTGITINFEKVAYPVMHEKLVPQLAAGPGNGSYDALEVDFYWVYEFARSGWVEDLGPLIEASNGQVDLA